MKRAREREKTRRQELHKEVMRKKMGQSQYLKKNY
jgi:hypothetical protein